MEDVAIIGAGLAGLSAAYHLKDGYAIFERESEVGGLCRSKRIDGFTFDYAVHILYSNDKYATAIIKKLLKNNFHSQRREAWIYSKNTYTRYPFQANTHGLPLNVIKDCLIGLIEAKYRKKTEPRNFEEFIYNVFGRGIAKHFMIPYNEKIWTVHPKEMNCDWIKYRVPIPTLEEVVTGVLKDQKVGFGPNFDFWYPFRGGIASLPNSFLPHIKNLNLNSVVNKIDLSKKMMIVNNEEFDYEKIISSMPITHIVKLIDNVPQGVIDAADNLKFNCVYTINLGVNRENISDKHWIYYPENKFIFHRISLPMNFSPNIAPKGTSSVTAEISYSKYKKIKMEGLIDLVINNLQKAGILKKNDEILVKDILNLSPAYIIYDHNHRKNVEVINNFLIKNDIYSCGRFGEFEYFNMDHSILSGKAVVDFINSKN